MGPKVVAGLEKEGVVFDQTGRIRLEVYRWKKPPRAGAPRRRP